MDRSLYSPTMIRLTVMYPASPGIGFDWDYYLTKHTPMARARLTGLGMTRLEVDRGLGSFPPGTPAPHHAIAYLYFPSVESCAKAMAASAAELIADMANYYRGQAVIQISEMLEA